MESPSSGGGEIMSDNQGKRFGLLKITAIVLVLLLAAVLALPFVLDVNQFRPQLESRLSDALGRQVKMGNLKLSILGGSVGVADIDIADNPAFSRSSFVTAKSLKASVELKPLIFSKEIRITGISLDQPAISLVRSSSGKWNFSDLGSKAGHMEEKRAESSGAISKSHAIIKELKITGGRVTITEAGKKPSVYDDVTITADNLSFTASFPFSIAASLSGGGKFGLEGKAGPLNQADLMTTPLTASLSINHFDLIGSGFVAPDSGLAGLVDFKGTVTSDGKQVKSEGKSKVNKLQVIKGGAPAGLPIDLDYSLNYDRAQKGGDLTDAKVQCGKAVAQLSGSYAVRGEDLNLTMKLRGMNMPVQDLTALLPAFGVTLPRGAALEGGLLNVDLTTEGPVNRLITTGTADISNTRLVGFDLSGKMSVLAKLAGLKSNQQTEIQKFTSGMRMAPEGIQVSNLLLVLPALGDLSGAGKIAPDQTLDFTMLAKLKPAAGIGSLLTRLTAGNGLSLPFFVRGSASDPKFVPDAKNAARSLFGSSDSPASKEGETLGNALRGLFKKKQ
jgi:AsmA protein